MNKKKFLTELNKGLKALSKSEIDDILDFYDERITNGTRSGKTEEEVISELEPINVIVKNTLLEFGIDINSVPKMNKEDVPRPKISEENKKIERKSSSVTLKYLGIILFDLLIGIWLVVGVIIAFCISVIMPFVLTFIAATSFLTTYDAVIQVCLFMGTLSIAILSIILVQTVWLITKYCVQLVLNLNYNVIYNTVGKKFEFKYNLRKSFKRYKLIAIFSGVVLIGSGTGFLMNLGEFKGNYLIEPNQTGYQYLEMDINVEKNVHIHGTFANVEVLLYDENSIKIEYEQFDEYGPSFILINSKENIKIDTNNPKTNRYNISPFQKRDEMDVVIYLPRDLDIGNLYIQTSGSITLDYENEMNVESFNVSSYGGDVIINNIVADEFSIYKDNWLNIVELYEGYLSVSNIKAEEISIRSNNTNTEIKNIVAHESYINHYGTNLIVENYTGVTVDYREPAILYIVKKHGRLIASNIEVSEGYFMGFSDIHISEFKGNVLNIGNENGDISILDSTSNKVNIENFDGDINIENLSKFDNDDNNIVIEIEYGNITMNNVYAAKVHINSKSGDIFYHNQDMSYEVELDIIMYDTGYEWIKDISVNEKS